MNPKKYRRYKKIELIIEVGDYLDIREIILLKASTLLRGGSKRRKIERLAKIIVDAWQNGTEIEVNEEEKGA